MPGPRLLLVDSNNKVFWELKTSLKKRGYRVDSALNGIKLASSLEVETPDLIIINPNNKWLDGFKLCSSLKSGKFGKIPVFFLSYDSTDEEIKNSYDSGCNEYFKMPEQSTVLLEKIRETVGTPKI